jgi:hypothetical protein
MAEKMKRALPLQKALKTKLTKLSESMPIAKPAKAALPTKRADSRIKSHG